MTVVITITKDDYTKSFQNQLAKAEFANVRVGIFDTNLEKAMIAEFGHVPVDGFDGPPVPARPFVSKTAEDLGGKQHELSAMVNNQLKNTGLLEILHSLGYEIAQIMKEKVASANSWAKPLAKSTVLKKGHDTILRDTDEMYNSIRYKLTGVELLRAKRLVGEKTKTVRVLKSKKIKVGAEVLARRKWSIDEQRHNAIVGSPPNPVIQYMSIMNRKARNKTKPEWFKGTQEAWSKTNVPYPGKRMSDKKYRSKTASPTAYMKHDTWGQSYNRARDKMLETGLLKPNASSIKHKNAASKWGTLQKGMPGEKPQVRKMKRNHGVRD